MHCYVLRFFNGLLSKNCLELIILENYNYNTNELFFLDLLKRLTNEIININSNFKLYRHLIKRLEDRLDAMEYAPSFFNSVMEALFTDVIMGLSKLFESKERSYGNIYTFLQFIEDNRSTFSLPRRLEREQNIGGLEDYIRESFLVEIEDKLAGNFKSLEEQTKRIKILMHWRDKYYAHNDKTYFLKPDLITTEMPLLYEDIEVLIDTATQILNDYSIRFDGKFKINYISNYDDIDNILDIIHEHHLKMLKEE